MTKNRKKDNLSLRKISSKKVKTGGMNNISAESIIIKALSKGLYGESVTNIESFNEMMKKMEPTPICLLSILIKSYMSQDDRITFNFNQSFTDHIPITFNLNNLKQDEPIKIVSCNMLSEAHFDSLKGELSKNHSKFTDLVKVIYPQNQRNEDNLQEEIQNLFTGSEEYKRLKEFKDVRSINFEKWLNEEITFKDNDFICLQECSYEVTEEKDIYKMEDLNRILQQRKYDYVCSPGGNNITTWTGLLNSLEKPPTQTAKGKKLEKIRSNLENLLKKKENLPYINSIFKRTNDKNKIINDAAVIIYNSNKYHYQGYLPGVLNAKIRLIKGKKISLADNTNYDPKDKNTFKTKQPGKPFVWVHLVDKLTQKHFFICSLHFSGGWKEAEANKDLKYSLNFLFETFMEYFAQKEDDGYIIICGDFNNDRTFNEFKDKYYFNSDFNLGYYPSNSGSELDIIDLPDGVTGTMGGNGYGMFNKKIDRALFFSSKADYALFIQKLNLS